MSSRDAHTFAWKHLVQLFGPRQWATRVLSAVFHRQKNAVVFLPHHGGPDDVFRLVNHVLAHSSPTAFDRARWTPLTVPSAGDIPAKDYLWSVLGSPESEPTPPTDLRHFWLAPRFQGKVIWLRGLTCANWPAWLDLLKTYHPLAANYDDENRPVFCLPLTGELGYHAPADPSFENCEWIGASDWKNAVDWSDTLFFVSSSLRQRRFDDSLFQPTPLEEQLATMIVTNLARWDLPLASELASAASLDEIFDPLPTLVRVAQRRRWTKENLKSPEWSEGMTERRYAVDPRHWSACLLALSDDPTDRNRHELRRRIWGAEVGVLFPYVDDWRKRLVHSYADYLRVPYPDEYDPVTKKKKKPDRFRTNDKLALEVGHLLEQYREPGSTLYGRLVEPESLLIELRDVRNELCHRGPLSDSVCDQHGSFRRLLARYDKL